MCGREVRMMIFKRPKKVKVSEWPAGDNPRVLFENPDLGVADAQAAALPADYAVAFCPGPQAASPRTRASLWSDEEFPASRGTICPATCGGECALADGADVIITTTNLVDADAVHAALEARPATVFVVEPGKMVDLASLEKAVSRSRGARPGGAERG
jgi:hypothetical protein